MPSFDASSYDPPAPVAIVTLRRSGEADLVGDVALLIDTGADMTLLPRWALARLGIAPQPNIAYEIVDFEGSRSTAQAADLDMIFLNKAFRGRYLLIDAQHGILGRDVLNTLRVLIDGPAQQWSEMMSR
jgi:hypothetical protein